MEKTIIVADDNLNCCNSILNFLSLSKSNFNVVGVANNGIDVLNLIDKYNPYFLILDLNMPNKNSIEVLKEIECEKRNLRSQKK